MTKKWIAAILVFLLTSLNSYAQNTPVKINDVSFNLPGEWKLINRNDDAGQFGFLETKKKINLAISARPPHKMEFYKPDLNEAELVKAYYVWEADYWKTEQGVEVTELKTDIPKRFIVWKLKTKQAENIILIGMKTNKLVGLFLNMNKDIHMSDEEATRFLEEIYAN